MTFVIKWYSKTDRRFYTQELNSFYTWDDAIALAKQRVCTNKRTYSIIKTSNEASSSSNHNTYKKTLAATHAEALRKGVFKHVKTIIASTKDGRLARVTKAGKIHSYVKKR